MSKTVSRSRLIPRPLYLDRIKPFIDKNLIKVLVGQRRVGKSYLLLLVQDYLKQHGVKDNRIIYVNKEAREFDQLNSYQDLFAYVERHLPRGTQKVYLMIDEVQEIKEFEKAIRSFNHDPRFDVYITGSNSGMLSSDLASLLSGRYLQMEIMGLNYQEFCDFHQLKPGRESVNQYLRLGGLPYLIHLEKDWTVISEYLLSVYDTILLNDVVKRYQLRNTRFLQDLIRFLADNIGNPFSANKISNYLQSQRIAEVSPKVILEYLGYLTSAFVFGEVKRKDVQGKKIFEFNAKYYMGDVGLRRVIAGYDPQDIDKLLENVVWLHLKSLGYEVFVGNFANKEIDFYIQKGDRQVYIQVAYLIGDKQTFEREFGNLLEIHNNYEKLVVSMDPSAGGEHQGVRHWQMEQFLTEFK